MKSKQKAFKLDLGKTLESIDLKRRNYYDRLSDEEKKQYAGIVLMRYMSSGSDHNNGHANNIQMVNEIANIDFWSLYKHPELQHLLFTVCANGKKQYHQWIPMMGKGKQTKLEQFIKSINPGINQTELNMLKGMLNKDALKELLKRHAVDEKLEKDILKEV